MRGITFLFGLVGVVSGVAYIITKNDFFFTTLMIAMPLLWTITAVEEWEKGNRFLMSLNTLLAIASFIVLGDIIFNYL
ncbi:hypothetical protein ACF3OH_02500 [Chryseomicrobium aureum]|uniref:hypothetical protein n=1 Tax=Chryseomicrobium aureum TaxID=1441723 RepID=UPI00370D5A69